MIDTIKVDGYNIATMTMKNWDFYHGITKLKTRKLVNDYINAGAHVTAKFKERL